jgi:hypothetical protein
MRPRPDWQGQGDTETALCQLTTLCVGWRPPNVGVAMERTDTTVLYIFTVCSIAAMVTALALLASRASQVDPSVPGPELGRPGSTLASQIAE